MFRNRYRVLRLLIRPFRLKTCNRCGLRTLLLHRFHIIRARLPSIIRSFRTSRCRIAMGLIPPKYRYRNGDPFDILPGLLQRISRIIQRPSCLIMRTVSLYHVTRSVPRQVGVIIRYPLRVNHTFRFFPRPRVSNYLRRRHLFLTF